MGKLVVLEHSTQKAHIYNVKEGVDINEEYLSNMGFDVSNCSWMAGDELGVYNHRGTLV